MCKLGIGTESGYLNSDLNNFRSFMYCIDSIVVDNWNCHGKSKVA